MAPRRAGRIDDNQRAIVDALRTCGATVQTLANCGHGVPDLLVGFDGQNLLLEVKDGAKPPSKRRLTLDQLRWHEAWQGQVAVVTSVADAVGFLVTRAAEEYDPPRIDPTRPRGTQ